MTRPPARLVITVLVLAACSGRPTPEKAEQERQRVSSAAASATMIAAAWDSGAAPAIFASPALGRISTNLLRTAAAPAWSALPPGPRRAIGTELVALRGVTAGMDSAIGNGDHGSLRGLRGRLEQHARALAAVPIDTDAP